MTIAIRDINFDIRGRDASQAAFDSATRKAQQFGRAVDRVNAQMHAVDRSARAMTMQSRQLMFQLVDVGQALATAPTMGIYALQNLGFQVAQIGQMYAGNGGFTAAVRDSAAMIGRFAARLAPVALIAGGVTAAIAGMQHEINATSGVYVTFGDTALAVLQTIRDGVYSLIEPAVKALAPWFATAWDAVLQVTKEWGNNLVRLALGSFEIVKTSVMSIPDAFIVAGEEAANGFLKAINQMVRGVIVQINTMISSIRGALRGTALEEFGNAIPMLDNKVPLQQVDLGGSAARDRLGVRRDQLDARAGEIANTDYMGQFFDAVSAHAVENALDRVKEKAKGAGKSLKDAGDKARDPWNGLTKELERMQNALQNAGQSVGGIIKGLISGTLSWRDALSQALEVAMRLMLQFNPNLFGGGFFQGLIGGLLGFGGARANGGPTDPWKTYLVGEKGPEFITMGGRPGHVSPARLAEGEASRDVSVRIAMDRSGNLQAYVEQTAGRVSAQVVQAAAPAIIDSSTRATQTASRDRPGFFR